MREDREKDRENVRERYEGMSEGGEGGKGVGERGCERRKREREINTIQGNFNLMSSQT